MWKSLMLKVHTVLQCAWTQTRTALLLGQPVYDAMFSTPHYSIATPPPTKLRFLRGQVVGKQLPPGKGDVDKMKAAMDPAMCQHPTQDMLMRGNKLNKWWLCKRCLCR